MQRYKVQKLSGYIQNANACFFFECDCLQDVKEYLQEKQCEFVEYSELENTVYYKDTKKL